MICPVLELDHAEGVVKPEEATTRARAYPVNVASFVIAVPASHGSPTWRLTYLFVPVLQGISTPRSWALSVAFSEVSDLDINKKVK